MSENIELKTFPYTFGKENDIEEYHEIDEKAIFQPNTNTQCRASKNRTKSITEEDFFTEYDVKVANRKPGKKKHAKKKTDTSNLMDIINSELAGLTPPVTEELVTTKVDHSKELLNTYFRSSGVQTFFKKPPCFIPEQGYGDKLLTTVLNPVYPKVLENAITEYQPIAVQYMEASKFEDVVATNESEDGLSKFLDFTIKDIKFLHHHELCLEELLCNKLAESYNEYKSNERLLSELLRDIKVNRETRDSLKEDFTKISAKKETIRFDETVRKYAAKLFYLKDKYLEHLNMRNEMLHKIGSLWSDVIMTREKSGNVRTAYILDIDKIPKDTDEYEKEWSRVFNVEYADKLDKLEYDYVTKYVEYKTVKANKSYPNVTKPKLEFDEDILKNEAETIANKIVPKDNIDVSLRQDPKITSDRRKFQTHQPKRYYFKVYVDNVFVCESDVYENNASDKLKVQFTESFSVQILPKNDIITVELYEQDESVSYVKIALNKIKETSVTADYKTEIFVFNNIVEPNTKHVGSGHNIKEIAAENKIRLKSSNLFKGNLYTTCEVSLRMGWNEKLNENDMESIKDSMEVGRKLKRLMHGIDRPDTDTLKSIIENIYEKDIGNDEEIISNLRRLCKLNIGSDDVLCPIDEDSPEFIRLKLLHLRNNGGFTNVENKMIPLMASQISTEQLRCLQKISENEFDVQYYDRQDMDPIEIQRYVGTKYVEKLNKNMLKNLSEHLLKKTHKDVVRDFKDLSLRSLFSNQSNLSLALSSSSRQQMMSEALLKEQEIRVSVFRALGLRDRSSPVVQNDEDDEKIAGFKIHPLRPFVRVSYSKISEQTTPAIGCHPTWNQTLKIKTKLSPLSSIQVNIFDEQRLPVAEDSDQPHTVHYRCQNKWLGCLQVPLKTVLDMGMLKGTFKISSPPFLLGYESSPKNSHSLIPEVTNLMRKEAAFLSLQITSSLSHLGGGQGYNQPVPTDPDDYIISHLNDFVTEYTNEFPSRNISLAYIDSTGQNKSVTHFLQPIPLPDYESFPKNPKSGSAMSKSSGRSSSSGKKKDMTEERSELESIYSSYSGKPDGMGKAMDACLRYVSLIPCYEQVEGRVVTLLGVELLKVLHGSPLDHAILLASYFLHLGLKCYIATGLGLPRGLSYYVLTKYDMTTHRMVLSSDQYKSKLFGRNDGFVWYVYDAVSGERFELRDVSCPLKSVDYVFDNENIWVNVQSSLDCESVSFDFTRSSDWQPVFDKSIFVMKLPVVTDDLYSAPVSVENLRAALEARIKGKVQQWRPHVKTIWNRYCSALLREVLPFWEYHAFNPTEQKPGLAQRLKQLMVTHKMSGFPLNMPFVNMKSVISTVKSTGLHIQGEPNAEFALGVEVYAYPNNVISVWVFLASISRI